MKYHVHEDFEERYFAPAPCSAKVRGMARLAESHGVIGYCRMGHAPKSEVGGFTVPRILKAGFWVSNTIWRPEDTYADAKLLISSGGAIVGWATLSRDSRWRPATAVLDLFFHPNFAADVPTLLSSVAFPDVKVQCYVDSSAEKKAEILETAGFTCEGRFKDQFAYSGQDYDVLVFGRG